MLTPSKIILPQMLDAPMFGARARSLHAAFGAQARRTPDQVAIVADADVLTYADLDARSAALAHRLRGQGVGAGDLVGMLAGRSAALVVGALGVLRAGAAYVPLDPAYPDARIHMMLDDTCAAAVVVEGGLAQRLPVGAASVQLSADGRAEGDEAPGGALPDIAPDAPAYIIYTSGSTGRPKGVVVEHRSVLNYVRGVAGRAAFTPGASYAMVQPLTVDSSVTMLYAALLSGGTLHLVSEAVAADPVRFGAYMERHAIDALKIAPSHLAALVQAAPEPHAVLPRRWLVIGGEASQRSWARSLQALAPDCAIFNHYGPTEATVGVTMHRVVADAADEDAALPIGTPLPGVVAYVLDVDGRRVAPGEVGELYVGGACLARGYLHRPELTAERFVRDPFADEPGARLYRTGDLVHARPDGALVFHGRADDQVKVNGYRIEPAEIEAVLNEHVSVRQCLVHAVEGPGGKRLVAYVVPEGEAPEASVLRDAVRAVLPPHMVPSAFVVLDALPRTAHGKIDRAALPLPAFAPAGDAPGTRAEATVAAVWAEVLGVEHVARDANFFDLGGHSLLAIRILGRLRAQTGTSLALPDLFETPTVAGLAAAIEARAEASGSGAPPLVARPRAGGRAPLSLAQRRLWYFTQLQPESPLYNMAKGLKLRGALDVEAFQQALDGLAARHEVLRTRFLSDDGEPFQQIDAPRPVPLHREDLRSAPDATRAAMLDALLTNEARRPFDLTRDHPIRGLVVALPEGEHALLLVIHHIASDGLSQIVLMRELAALYVAARVGCDAALPVLEAQYADYAQWHREAVEGTHLDTQRTFWKRKLDGLPFFTLPSDRPRPTPVQYSGAEHVRPLDPSVVAPLAALSREMGASPFMTLLTAFDALLAFYTGATDVPVAATAAGRDQVETEGLIGFFANLVVMRLDLSGDPSFREALRRVRAMALEAYANQDVPFDQVVEAVQPPRDPRYAPLVQVVFALQDVAALDFRVPGIEAEPLEIDKGTAKYDIVFDVLMDGDVPVSSMIEYSTSLYDEGTARRFLHRYNTLLGLAAAHPDVPLSALKQALDALVPSAHPESANRVAEALRLAQGPPPVSVPAPTLHGLFEQQVARTPEAPAVAVEGETLSYRALEAYANRLARYLRQHGVGPEVCVGVEVPRTAEAVVALLAVLKAGGAYVPLDPSYPRERRAFMAGDADLAVLLTRGGDTPVPAHTHVIDLERDAEAISALAPEPVTAAPAPDALAYVIYTSGSTGQPKGVMVTHRTAVHATLARNKAYPEPVEAFLLLSSFSFDSSVAGLFWTLASGGCLVLGPADAVDPRMIARQIQAHSVTHLLCVPSLYRLVLDEADAAAMVSLRVAIVAGEACPPSLVDLHRARLPGARLCNEYGPTEATVWCTVYDTARWDEDRLRTATLPIGRPIAGARVYVLGTDGQPVAVGDEGEICVGGAGVARGYLHRPELTAERFVADPFAGEPSARLYRTGDRGRYLPDGTLLFLGRTDEQVKLRGYRIELGEIEAALRQVEGVRDAAVVMREHVPGAPCLAAYLVGDSSGDDLAHHARQTLRSRLPAYMVPSIFGVLDALPRSPNGKLDRRALPAADSLQSEAERPAYVAPGTSAEVRMAALWAELLGVERVSAHADFFDLGGHSLLAVKLFARIEKVFGASLPLATLFTAPTVAQLAALLENDVHLPADSPIMPIQTEGQRPPIYGVHGPHSGVMDYKRLSKYLGPEQPVYGIQGQGADGHPIAFRTVEEMAARYVGEIRRVHPQGPYVLISLCLGGVLVFEMAARLRATGETVAVIIVDGPTTAWKARPADAVGGGPETSPASVRSAVPPPVSSLDARYVLAQDAARHDSTRIKAVKRWARKVVRPRWLKKVRKRLALALAGAAHARGRRAPRWTRWVYNAHAHGRIMGAHQPAAQAGDIVLVRRLHRPEKGDPTLGWGAVAHGGVHVRTVDGPHYLLAEPYLGAVAEHVRATVDAMIEPQHG